MTRPRAHLVDTENRGMYHVVSRCVRRAWLCGEDSLTKRSFDHRRQWIEDRLHYLAKRFAVAIHAYAIMSNHYHVVVEVDPRAPEKWDDLTIARRWLDLYPPKRWLEQAKGFDAESAEVKAILADPSRLALLRTRLGSLSWFMKLVNEPIARIANREDACTGRFWEGRFRTSALLDEAAALAAMTYVDLNPSRAGIATDNIAAAPHTSIRYRTHGSAGARKSLSPVACAVSSPTTMNISLSAYLSLLEYTARRANRATPKAKHALREIGVNALDWWPMVQSVGQKGRSVFGQLHHLEDYMRRVGQHWVRGVRSVA